MGGTREGEANFDNFDIDHQKNAKYWLTMFFYNLFPAKGGRLSS
jgi:hypothetical protein